MKKKPNGLGFAGAIVSIVGSGVLALNFFYLAKISFIVSGLFNHPNITLGIVWLLLAMGSVVSVVFSSLFLTNYSKKIPAGILSIIFGGVIGGVLILVSSEDEETSTKETSTKETLKETSKKVSKEEEKAKLKEEVKKEILEEEKKKSKK